MPCFYAICLFTVSVWTVLLCFWALCARRFAILKYRSATAGCPQLLAPCAPCAPCVPSASCLSPIAACLMPYAKCFITLCFNKQHKQLPRPLLLYRLGVQQAWPGREGWGRDVAGLLIALNLYSTGNCWDSLVLHLTGRALNCLAPLRYFLAIYCITYTPPMGVHNYYSPQLHLSLPGTAFHLHHSCSCLRGEG